MILFCSDLCKDEAELVRYYRACKRDGRIERSDVKEAIGIQLAMILAGGYHASARRLSADVRASVIERDQGLCRICHAHGTQIDHICGDSGALANLQLLCERCHNAKTVSRFIKLSPETHPREWAHHQGILQRVEAVPASRLCDSEEWKNVWRTLKARRLRNANVSRRPSHRQR
jgi:5-methylcytosine-specific restriction endonuclease McrA